MSCSNFLFLNLTTLISSSCGENGHLKIIGCSFIELNGISVRLNCGISLNAFTISSSSFAFCSNSALSISGKYDGIIEKCCFYCVVAVTGSVVYSTATFPSSISFSMSSNAFCPNLKQGSYVFYLHNLNTQIKNTNSTYSMVSYHTMFEFENTNYQFMYDSICHNGMGCVIRIGGTCDGYGNYTNHVNNSIVGTDWCYVHDWSSSIIIFSFSLYMDILHKKYSWNGKSSFVESTIFGCVFSPNNIFNRPIALPNYHLDLGLCKGKELPIGETKHNSISFRISLLVFHLFL